MEPLPENHCESGGVEMEYAVSPTHRKAVKLQVRRRSVEQCSLSFSSEASLPLHLMETDQQKGNIAPECMYDGSFTKVMEAGGLTERIEKTCTKVQVEQKQKLVFVSERIDTPDINIVPCNDSRKEKERERNPILIDLTKSGEERHVVTSRPRIRTRREELPLCSNTLLAYSCAGEEHDIKSSHKSATDCSQERVEMVSSLKTLELGVSEMSENFSRDLQNEIGRRTEKKDMNELLVVGTPDEVPSGQPSQPPRTISPLYKPNKVRFKLSQDTVVKRPRGRPRKNLNPPLQRKGFSDRRRARGRKKRAPSTSSESEKEDQDDENIAEGLIAASLGFPKHSLSDEEIRAGIAPSKLNFEQAEYVEVRNHILAKWREDVNSWLTLDTVMISIQDRFQPIVDVAYNFLSTFGYINFGVAPAMKSHMPEEPTEARVVVIGAGLAGLAAARQLKAFGHDVVVLEGRKRPGGRVFTQRMVGDDMTAAADLGGSVLTGFQANPLGVLVRQLGLSLKPIKEDCPLYNPHGLQVDLDMDRNVQKYFNELLDRASRCGKAMSSISEHLSLGCTLDVLRERGKVTMNTEEGQLLDWHFANLEFSNAASLSNLSLAYWDQDDAYELVGDHCFVEGGNVELVEALAEGLTIVYDTKVDSISYGSGHVLVTAGEMHFQGEFALCTVPLGILKQGLIKFEPDLPKLKLDAIRRLGFGLLNKLAMLFPCAFWGDGVDTFGHVGEHRSSRGEYFLFYSYVGVSRFPLLIALVAGEAAITFERNKAIENVARVMTILGEIFKPKGISVPDPLQVVCTRWGKDQFTFGSYSNIAVGASGKDYDILAESVGHGRLYFAGEATSRHYPATMHGAFLSGLREAGNISVRAGSSKHTSCIRREPDSDIESSAHVFAEIFKKPDVEFGCFSVVFDLNADENNSGSALLKVLLSRDKTRTDEDLDIPIDVGSKKMSIDQLKNLKHGVESAGVIQQRAVHVYAAVTRKQALELMDVRGGDGHRLKYLVEALGVKLVGRKGLGEAAEKIVNARLFGSLKGFSRGNNT